MTEGDLKFIPTPAPNEDQKWSVFRRDDLGNSTLCEVTEVGWAASTYIIDWPDGTKQHVFNRQSVVGAILNKLHYSTGHDPRRDP